MPAYETIRDMSVAMWARIRFHYTRPSHLLRAATNQPAYETPYVWSREFLEESGFNLTEGIPAILAVRKLPGVTYSDTFTARQVVSHTPPSFILELLLHWIVGIYRSLVDSVCGLGLGDLPWLLTVGVITAVAYCWRSKLASILSTVWEELKEDVATYVRRQFPPACEPNPPPVNELPPGTATISAEDIKAMHLSADAIQRRINLLRMSKINFVRSRTGVVFNLNTFSKLQMQLTEAQEALKKEKTKRARPMVNFVRSRRAGVVVRGSTQGESKLKKELEKLQARFNTQEDERDTWREAFQTLEEQSDVKAVGALQDQRASDNAHNERRIGALETQLGFERTNREEAQTIARDLRSSHTKLQGELREAKARYESLESAYGDLDAMHGAEESANEAKSEEITNLKAENDRLQAALTNVNAPHPAPLRRVRSASLWLPPPHHGDTFDPLYDVSDYGDDKDEDREDFELPDGTAALDLLQNMQVVGSEAAPVAEDPFDGEDPFPEIGVPEPMPAPRATGPGQTRNAHVQKLNQEVKRLDWRRKSGFPDSVEEEEGVAGPDDVLDDMYDRQVAQTLSFAPTPFARGSMWGALNDVPKENDAVDGDSEEEEEDKEGRAEEKPDEEDVETSEAEGNLSENSQPSSPLPPSERDPRQQDVTPPLPVQQSPRTTREPSSSAAGTNVASSPTAQGPIHDGPNAKAAHVGPTARQGPSNYWAGTKNPSHWAGFENATPTWSERVGDAMSEIFAEMGREKGFKTLSQSRWADKSDTSSKATTQQAPSTAAEGLASLRTLRQSGVGETTSRAPIGSQGPSAGTERGSSSSSPRGNGRGRGGRHAPEPAAGSSPAPAQTPPVFNPPTGPRNPTRGSGTRGPGFNSRGRGAGGRPGRGGPATPTPVSSGPARGPASASAADSFRQFQERMKKAAEDAKNQQK